MPKKIKTLNVEGMSCSHCENSVEKSVGALEGINSIVVDLKGKKVTVEYNSEKVNLDTIKKTIEDLGFDVE